MSAPPLVIAGTDQPPVPVRHAATGRAATRLSGVSVHVSDGKLVATLAGNGNFAYDTFSLENPPRYVVDLPGVLLAMPKRTQDVKHAAVSRVRVSQFKAGPEPVTRVVFDLASPSEPAAKPSTSALALVFGSRPAAGPTTASAGAPAAPAAASKASPASEPQPALVRAAPEKVASLTPVPAAASASSSGRTSSMRSSRGSSRSVRSYQVFICQLHGGIQ